MEATALAKNSGWILLSNDKVIEKVAGKIGINVYNLEDLLSAMIYSRIIKNKKRCY